MTLFLGCSRMLQHLSSYVLHSSNRIVFSIISYYSDVKLSLLCSSCRVRPLSESLNDLFREVSLLRKRITELSHRLATLEPFLRHYGYREKEGEAARGGRAQSLRGEVATLARYHRPGPPPRGTRVVRRRRVRVLKNGGVRLVQRVKDTH